MSKKDLTKNFIKFIETDKFDFFKKAITDCGVEKIKLKSFYRISNLFSLEYKIDHSLIVEYVASNEKDISKNIYNNELFNNSVNVFLIHYQNKKDLNNEQLIEYVKYMQDTIKNFNNCNYAVLIFNNNVYTISKKTFNGVDTFIEVLKSI